MQARTTAIVAHSPHMCTTRTSAKGKNEKNRLNRAPDTEIARPRSIYVVQPVSHGVFFLDDATPHSCIDSDESYQAFFE